MSEIERHWSSRAGFTRRYAIRLPSGQLYTGYDQMEYEQACQAYAEFMAMPAPMRDMAQSAIFGFFGGGAPRVTEPPKPPEPKVFDRRVEAEELLRELRSKATAVGVLGWGGCVVEQLCTPFTSGDPALEFAEQVEAWVQEQDGGAQ